MTGRLGMFARGLRNFSTSIVRPGGHGRPGCPGENFPMNLNASKARITIILTLFFGIGLGAPWAVVWWSFVKGK